MTATTFRTYEGIRTAGIEKGSVGSASRDDSCYFCARRAIYLRDRSGYCFYCRMRSELNLRPKQAEAFEMMCTKPVTFERWRKRWYNVKGTDGSSFSRLIFERLVLLELATVEEGDDSETYSPRFDLLKKMGYLFEEDVPLI